MNIILQPCASKEAMIHFKDTIDNGVLINKFKDREYYKDLLAIGGSKIKVWGVQGDSEWKRMKRGDLVLFYKNRKFFYIAKVFLKVQSKELAEELWGVDEKGKAWEYLYFIDEGMEISAPYNPTILKRVDGNNYKENHIVQGIQLLKDDNAEKMWKYIHEHEGEIIDENLTEELAIQREQKIKKEIEKVQTVKDIEEKLAIFEKNSSTKERVVTVKAFVRNSKISSLIKEKAGYVCEICGAEPFIKKNGELYAEAHHVDELAISRKDVPSNMICVCPTCHRILHYGSDEALKKRINKKVNS